MKCSRRNYVIKLKIHQDPYRVQSLYSIVHFELVLILTSGYNCDFRYYYAMPKLGWTPILAEHFLEHTRLKCCLAFRRAKVTPGGKDYVVVVGKCSTCQSYFKGTISERPNVNSRFILFISMIIYIFIYQKIH